MKRQTIDNLKGEIGFRRFHNRFHDEVLDYMAIVLRHRVPELQLLMTKGIGLSPFLEIGAETGPNSLALANGCRARGYALDISLDSLAAMPEYASRLGLSELPARICADALNLPFVNRGLAFELCWGTLHHFPDPGPAIRELRRVVRPDGLMLFDGEPVRRLLSLHIWQSRDPSRMGLIERSLLRIGLLAWLADISGSEPMKMGAMENKFPVRKWKQGLSPFERIEFDYRPLLAGDIQSAGPLARSIAGLLPRRIADRLLTFLFGGTVFGTARPGKDIPAISIMDDGVSSDISDGGDLIVRKRRGHDRIRLRTSSRDQQPWLDLVIEGTAVQAAADGGFYSAGLPEPAISASVISVSVKLPRDDRLKSIVLCGGSESALIIPACPLPTPDPERILACPACLIISDRCDPEQCGASCLNVCPHGALSISNNRAAIDLDRCRPCMDCARACPLGAIDRQPLEGDIGSDAPLVCKACGDAHVSVNGVRMLLAPAVRKELYPDI